jgi:hypothetical protein
LSIIPQLTQEQKTRIVELRFKCPETTETIPETTRVRSHCEIAERYEGNNRQKRCANEILKYRDGKKNVYFSFFAHFCIK